MCPVSYITHQGPDVCFPGTAGTDCAAGTACLSSSGSVCWRKRSRLYQWSDVSLCVQVFLIPLISWRKIMDFQTHTPSPILFPCFHGNFVSEQNIDINLFQSFVSVCWEHVFIFLSLNPAEYFKSLKLLCPLMVFTRLRKHIPLVSDFYTIIMSYKTYAFFINKVNFVCLFIN